MLKNRLFFLRKGLFLLSLLSLLSLSALALAGHYEVAYSGGTSDDYPYVPYWWGGWYGTEDFGFYHNSGEITATFTWIADGEGDDPPLGWSLRRSRTPVASLPTTGWATPWWASKAKVSIIG